MEYLSLLRCFYRVEKVKMAFNSYSNKVPQTRELRTIEIYRFRGLKSVEGSFLAFF